MYPKTIEIKLIKEDFEGSNYYSHQDCALARGINRAFEMDPSIESLKGFIGVGGDYVCLYPRCSQRDFTKELRYNIPKSQASSIVDIYRERTTPEFPFIVTLRKA
jgi:hypothetical protein